MSDIRLIADENIPWELIETLRQKGYEIFVPARWLEDVDIGRLAQKERRIILTQDKDFTNPFIFPPKNFHGIIRIRIHPPIIEDILKSLETLFAAHSSKDIDGKLIILEKTGSRIL